MREPGLYFARRPESDHWDRIIELYPNNCFAYVIRHASRFFSCGGTWTGEPMNMIIGPKIEEPPIE